MKIFLLPPPGLPVPAVKGGAVETLLTHLINENEKSGRAELVICCTPDADAQQISAGYKHTKVHYIAQNSIRQKFWGPICGALRRAGKAAPLDCWYNEAFRILKEEKPDIFVAEGGDLTEPEAICEYMGRDRCFAHLHMQLNAQPKLERMYGNVIAISKFVADSYQNTLPVNKHIVFNCVDLEKFSPIPVTPDEKHNILKKYGYKDDDFIVMFCGRICPEKGIDRLVNAFTHIDNSAIKLLIVGSPFFAAQDTSPFMENLIRDAEILGDRVKFTGYLPNDQLPPLYRSADAACFPAIWDEPAGITAIEAMACGCPIVATDSGGMTEYLMDSNAILLARDSRIDNNGQLQQLCTTNLLPAALSLKISTLSRDKHYLQTMSQAGSQRAMAFSSGNYYNSFLDSI